MRTYSNKVYLIGFDVERIGELRLVLGTMSARLGKERIRTMLRSAHEGTPVLVYQSNDFIDADERAERLRRVGGVVRVEG